MIDKKVVIFFIVIILSFYLCKYKLNILSYNSFIENIFIKSLLCKIKKLFLQRIYEEFIKLILNPV